MNSNRPAFGAMLRKLRIAAVLSQEALAERAHISVQAVGALERGARHAPQRQTLELLVAALDLDDRQRADFESAAAASTKARVRGSREAQIERPSIPRIPTSFVGRDRERDEVAALIVAGRCTTLWGSGGIGKTRLVLETIATLEDRFPDGIHFVELAPVAEDGDVVRAVASAAGVREETGRELAESLVRALDGKRVLLVLDNMEHVIHGCASLVDRLLREVPSLAVVATSREPLHVHGENVYPVGTLPIPAMDDPGLASSPAIRLFLDRAADAGAPVDDSNDSRRAIAGICTRLDAIPLAIELAAARSPLMSVRQIASGLDDRFRLLSGGARTASARQKTLHETLDWSYALLSDVERIVLRRVAVWPGTWTIDDAVALAGNGLTRWDVIEAIGRLVDRSLVVASPASDDDERRYSLLQSTEAFAIERAQEAGELDMGRRLQAERAAALLSDGVRAWRGSGDTHALLAIDVAPVRAALRWSLTLKSDVHLGTILAGHASVFWDLRAMQVEALRWLDDAFAIVPEDDDLARAEASMGRARTFAKLLQQRQSYDATVDAIRYADRSGDRVLRVTARSLFAGPASLRGEYDEARRALDEAMELNEQIGDERLTEVIAWQRGYLAMGARDYAETIEFIEPLVAKARRNGSFTFAAEGAITLGEAEFARGDSRAAIARGEEALMYARAAHGKLSEANAMQNLAAYHLDVGNVSQAAAVARACLESTFANGYGVFTSVAIGHLAEVVWHRGHEREAAVLTGYVDARMSALGTRRSVTEQRGRDRLTTKFANAFESAALEIALREGASLDEEGAAALAFDLSRDAG